MSNNYKNPTKVITGTYDKMELCKCMGSEVNQWWYTEVQCEPYHSEV